MITSLSIENFALIEKLSVNFTNGFSVITGETGAGKSILLGALGLVLGNRADLTSLKNKDEKCIIEAQFFIKDYNLKSFFEDNDLDYEDDTVIRREILPSGKSRAFINDTPVNLSELQSLSFSLLDIHSQHQTQQLSDDKMQFQIIDAVARNENFISEYSDSFRQFKKVTSELNAKQKLLQEVLNEQEYNSYLLDELVAANLSDTNQIDLENEFEKLNNVEFIKENLSKALSIISDEQIGVLANLTEVRNAIQKTSNFSLEYKDYFDRISSIVIELDDIEKTLAQSEEELLGNPDKLNEINNKLQLVYSLQKKHQVTTVDELLDIQNNLDSKVVSVVQLEVGISKSLEELANLETLLNEIAFKISENRTQAIPVLTSKLTDILKQLGMENARFDISLIPSNNFLNNGKDELQFLFAANKGSSFGLLKKVASGGEMSRIMLAVKAVLSSYSSLPTIIFDEIDTGVSGEIAHKMGAIMKDMSKNMQVFSITHLPQIAGKGTAHFKVFKTVTDNKTVSELKILNHTERITEIAQMLSGSVVSDSALIHAKELLL